MEVVIPFLRRSVRFQFTVTPFMSAGTNPAGDSTCAPSPQSRRQHSCANSLNLLAALVRHLLKATGSTCAPSPQSCMHHWCAISSKLQAVLVRHLKAAGPPPPSQFVMNEGRRRPPNPQPYGRRN
jgi:hypothetical protein